MNANITHPYFLERYKIEKTLRKTAQSVRGTMLDIGCGRQPYRSLFPHAAVIGLDTRFKNLGGEQTIVDIIGDASILPVRDNACNAVLSTQMLMSVTDPLQFFREIYRVLQAGGTAIISNVLFYPTAGHVDFLRLTDWGFKHIAAAAGFRECNILPTSGFVQTVCVWFLYFWNYRLLKSQGKARYVLAFIRIMLTPLTIVLNSTVNLLGMVLGYVEKDRTVPLSIIAVLKK